MDSRENLSDEKLFSDIMELWKHNMQKMLEEGIKIGTSYGEKENIEISDMIHVFDGLESGGKKLIKTGEN